MKILLDECVTKHLKLQCKMIKQAKYKMRLSIFKRAFNQDIKMLRVTYVILLLAIVGGIFLYTVSIFHSEGALIEKSFKERYAVIEGAIFSDTSQRPEVKQLKEQYLMIAKAKESNLTTAEKFNTYGFSFTVLFAIFSIVSGILGFLLLRKGWDNTNNFYLKSSFLVVFFCSTLFGILPNVFDNKVNTKENLTKYFYYNGLQIDIYNLLKDNKGYLKRNTSASLDSLRLEIYGINKAIKDNQDLFFDTHVDKVPTNIKPSFD